MAIKYPDTLLVGGQGEPGLPISAWIIHTTPAKTTETSQAVIVFLPSEDDVIFKDFDGNIIPPYIILKQNNFLASPNTIYISHENVGIPPSIVKTNVEIMELSGQPTVVTEIQMQAESGFSAFSRFLFSTLLSPSIVLGIVLTSAVGFAIQQWKNVREDVQRIQNKRDEASNQLVDLLHDSFALAANFYEELLQSSDYELRTLESRRKMEKIWIENTPPQLCDLFNLWIIRFADADLERFVKKIGTERLRNVFEWATTTHDLDDDWRRRIGLLILRTQVDGFHTFIKEQERLNWITLLKPWPAIFFWNDDSQGKTSMIRKALDYLSLEKNPFVSTSAETDSLLPDNYYYGFPVLDTLQKKSTSIIVVGNRGSGKTSMIFWLMKQCIQKYYANQSTRFPVYLPVVEEYSLDLVAKAIAVTLLQFIAVNPDEYLNLDNAKKTAFTKLISKYFRQKSIVSSALWMAGLSSSVVGRKLEKEILSRHLECEVSFSENELLVLLRNISLYSFDGLKVFIDFSGHSVRHEKVAWPLIDIINVLSRANIVAFCFLTPGYLTISDNFEFDIVNIDWTEDQLMRLLERRLSVCNRGVHELKAWCSSDVNLDDFLRHYLRSSGGLPLGLIQKGNGMLRRIGENIDNSALPSSKKLLSHDDLKHLLG